ncbi:MAG: hypothetical protein P8186_16520 [Anaerolineae bacterium]|jgi:hypothetical protein
MDIQITIAELEKEWEQPTGFLGRLRMGVFDSRGLERLVQVLQSVEMEDTTTVNRRFVALAWYIPIFMVWQRERVEEQGGNVQKLDLAINRIQGLLETILGVP